MRCNIKNHENFDTCGICFDIYCNFQSRLVCPKCLMGPHQNHSSSIILFNDIIETKQKDIEYLRIFPEIQDINSYTEEGSKSKNALGEISLEIEKNSSLIYDLIFNQFNEFNQNIKKQTDTNLKFNGDLLDEALIKFEELSLYENTNLFINKNITAENYQNVIQDGLINKLKEIKFILSEKNLNKQTHDHFFRRDNFSKKIKLIYSDFKSDLLNLFKKYNSRCESLQELTITGFNLVPNNYAGNKNVAINDIKNPEGIYTIKGKNLCLVGDKPLNGLIEKWKVKIQSASSFSCCGFGIGSLDDPNIITGNLSSNNETVLICLCCNGPWSAKGMKIVNSSYKIGPKLINDHSDNSKEIIFEINKLEDKFKIIYNGNLHADFILSTLKYKENLVPIINCTSGVNFIFKLDYTKEEILNIFNLNC
jgi:hypothetical protein